jgi:cytochrome c biogenesis protein CcdA
MTVFVGDRIVLEGHIPPHLVRDLLTAPAGAFERIIVYQDKMEGITDYRIWAFAGEVETFPVDTSLDEALGQIEKPGPGGLLVRRAQLEANMATLLPVVILTGLLDSVNPCAFAVILLLLAFLFTIRESRGRIIRLGGVYILMIFLVYFGIGLGIMRAVQISNQPHFMAYAGSWLLIGLGTLNIIEHFWPRFPIKLHMPAAAHRKTNEMLKIASVPATVVMGVLVGLCTFPCSGGIYVSIITLLNAKTTLGWGLGYLTLYNVLFILPLVGILLAVGNRPTAKAWARWEREQALRIRLWYGIIMVALGAIMLIWVI